MKKLFTSFVLLVVSFLVTNAQIKKVDYRGAFAPSPTVAWTDQWANFDPQSTVYPSTSANPAGGTLIKVPSSGTNTVITSNTTWTSNNTYIIVGLVYVKAGVTLTIQPGTKIFGSNAVANSSLIICKGAKLIADGTAANPIVFTSMYPPGFRKPGDWGGIVLLGRAPYNGQSSATSPTPNTFGINYIEGITEVNNSTTGESTEFGGGTSPNVNDTSGILRYVRIEFGGYIFSQNKEINGLTLGAVGKGTVIDYVQCSYINDDAFEWFGGNVNCSHLISYRGVDDEFDTDNGFSGSVQFCLGVRDPLLADNTYSLASGSSTSEGFESDNDANGSNNNPRTKALFTNMTLIGPLRGDNASANLSAIHPAFKRAARIRRNSELKIFNSILSDYPTGLMIDNSLGNTGQAAVDGRMKFKNNIISGVKSGGLTEISTSGTAFPSGFNARTFVLSSNDSAAKASTYLTAPYGTGSLPSSPSANSWAISYYTSADYRPKDSSSIAATGASFSDSAFNLYNVDSIPCVQVATPSSINAVSSSITSLSDTLKTFSVDTIATADVYTWSVTGTGNSIVTGSNGFPSVNMIIKSAGTVSLYVHNYCSNSSVVTKAITCPSVALPSSIVGDTSITSSTDTIKTFKVTTDGVAHRWSVTGSGNYILFPSNSIGDSIVVVVKSSAVLSVSSITVCTSSVSKTRNITCNITPVLNSISGPTNAYNCTLPSYTALTSGSTTGLTYTWTITGTGNAVASQSSNSASFVVANAGTISVTATGCKSSTPVTLAITKTLVATPASITIATVKDSCGNRVYRYSAPALPTGASAYDWSFIGTLGVTASIDSGSLTSQVVKMKYTSNKASATGDSVKLRYYFGCGYTSYKASKLSNALRSVPAAPATLTITIVKDSCGNRVYRYAAPSLPAATTTTGNATGYQWSFKGTLGVNATLDSGSLTSQVVRMKYTSNNAAATGDSVIVFYKSNCGNSANKASKLTNALRSVPAAPATLTITIVKDSCGNRVYRYAAPSLPAATTTTGNATGYQWSFKGSLGVNATLDSGSLTSMVVRMKYTSNIAAATGDSVIVYYTSDCGNSLKKASKLSNATTSAPATPTAITITLVWDFCGERVYRYSTTALASSFTNTGWGYKWSFVGDLGNNATLDSGSLTSQVVRMKYTSNNAAATGDSVKLNYVRGVCSSTSFKASKLSNLVKACREAAPNGRSSNNDLNSIHSSIYPNPNSGQFNLAYETNIQENCPAIIQIIDMKGVVVNQFNALNTNGIVRKEINDKKINNGFFIVRIIVNNKSFNTKMFIQK